MTLREFLRARHPAQLIVAAFALAAFAGGGILMLPAATVESGGAGFLTALFTSVSSICVTGLIVVDTATYWSEFGQAVIMVLIQIGGLGIMTLTSLLVFLVAKRLGLRGRLIAQAETSAAALSDVRRLVYGVVTLSLVFEAIAATILFIRFLTGYDYSVGRALWHAVFHAVTAFNNAGFALYSDNLMGFVTDGWISVTISLAVVAGGLGFPVWLELFRIRSPNRWTLHTKLTLLVTGFLLALGTLAILGFEWSNDGTLGPLGVPGKLLAAFFQGVQPRTAGFNTIDNGEMGFESLLISDMLMFVGTGSGSTGGGIKVTTFALLALMVWAEVRGEPSVNAFGRRIPENVQRQAFAVAFIALNAVVIGTLVLMATSPFTLSQTLYEALSAFGTVGLSTGITADLGTAGQWVLIMLMYLGRVGPHTLGVALALRERERHYRYPEDRPIIG